MACYATDRIKDKLLTLNLPRLSQDHVDTLDESFSESEVRQAIFQTGPLKFLGIDGNPTIFYQAF